MNLIRFAYPAHGGRMMEKGRMAMILYAMGRAF